MVRATFHYSFTSDDASVRGRIRDQLAAHDFEGDKHGFWTGSAATAEPLLDAIQAALARAAAGTPNHLAITLDRIA